MRITLHSNTYSGVAGSSMSDTRCDQTLTLYEFVKSHPEMQYVDVRRETVNEHLYKSESVLRTFCPLLKELGFITYETNEPFGFTPDGDLLASILKAIRDIKMLDDASIRDAALNKLEDAKSRMIELGILNMNRSTEPICREHNMWVVLYIIKELGQIDWNEFFLALKVFKEDHGSLSDFRTQITTNRSNGVDYETYNENGQPVADTQWSYIKSLLKEANLIYDIDRCSAFTPRGIEFVNKVTLWNL